MKKSVVSILVCVLLISCVLPYRASATAQDYGNIIYLDDGSYIIETVTVAGGKAMGTVAGTKTRTCYNSVDVIQWEAVVHGNFTYTGTVAICTSSTCDVTIYNSNCFVDKNLPYISSNRACADVCIGYRMLGITIRKDTYDIRLTCDVNGNLS